MYQGVRTCGQPPYRVAVLHGGPGAPGYMAPVAQELSRTLGVIEPLQGEDSLEGQIEELHGQLTTYGASPITLIGSSWGAVVALFAAARYPALTEKLILVGCAVFDAASSAAIQPVRLERLNQHQRRRLQQLEADLPAATADRKKTIFAEWGEILSGADSFDPLTSDSGVLEVQPEMHEKVWADFVALRDEPGRLAREFASIKAPVRVIHGDYDPHPIDGIRPFLESCLSDVRFEILPRCGHYPWNERHARDRFFNILRTELARPG
jgi:pimeloyl-ACP methyl ester carboxylesterase